MTERSSFQCWCICKLFLLSENLHKSWLRGMLWCGVEEHLRVSLATPFFHFILKKKKKKAKTKI